MPLHERKARTLNQAYGPCGATAVWRGLRLGARLPVCSSEASDLLSTRRCTVRPRKYLVLDMFAAALLVRGMVVANDSDAPFLECLE